MENDCAYILTGENEDINLPKSLFDKVVWENFLRRCGLLRSRLNLSQQEIEHGIYTACEFFGIPYPRLIIDLTNKKNGLTMFLNADSKSYSDDIICYNIQQLESLGVKSQAAFSLIMTHECAHRFYQNSKFSGPFNGAWEEELVCDYFMGVRAIMDQLNIKSVVEGIGATLGSRSHPDGDIRRDVILYGKQTVLRFAASATPLTHANFHDAIMTYLFHTQLVLVERALKYS